MLSSANTAWAGIDPTAVGGVLWVTVTAMVWETVEPLLSVAVTVIVAGTQRTTPVIVTTLPSTAAVATVLFEDIAE